MITGCLSLILYVLLSFPHTNFHCTADVTLVLVKKKKVNVVYHYHFKLGVFPLSLPLATLSVKNLNTALK